MPEDQLDSSSFSPDMCDFLALLHKHEVKYMIVGGEAVIFYGYARLTGDIDFFYERSLENAEKLFDVLLEFWGGSVPDLKDAGELLDPGLILQFGVPPNRIDLINQISGVEFEDAWPSRKTVSLVGQTPTTIQYLGLSSLIQNKKASRRDKDIDDVNHLEASD
jgi:hypothetical protein